MSRGCCIGGRGGALPAREGALEDLSLREKEQLPHRKEKLHIASAGARLLKEDQVVVRLGHDDDRHRPRTARVSQTNRYYQRRQYCGRALEYAVDVILTGGTLRKNSFSLVGRLRRRPCAI